MPCQITSMSGASAELSLNYAVINETPTGSVDGVNDIFTLDNVPCDTDQLAVYFNGFRMTKVAATPSSMEFTIAGQIITLGLVPNTGDTVRADYIRGACA